MEVNGDRLYKDIRRLGSVGFVPGRGTSRMAYSEAFCQGRELVREMMEQAGLATAVDPVGNLTGRLEGSSGRVISIGSHIDTVPEGGIFDGALGVLAGVELVRTLREHGYKNQNTIEIIAFNEEEGNVVGGTFGSKAFTGQRQEEDALERMEALGMSPGEVNRSRREPGEYLCYLELHIEQGGILERKQIPLGVVEGIFGIVRYKVTVPGTANHAGSTPMYLRDDALVKASRMIGRLVELAGEINPSMTCTIGKMDIEPGAVNVIPGRVDLYVELRCMDTSAITKTMELFQREFAEVKVENFLWQNETRMDERLQEVLRTCCRERGIEYLDMPSGAGHDAINMALFTPSAMIFIPSLGGVSHSVREESRTEDIERGANLLLDAVLNLDGEEVRR